MSLGAPHEAAGRAGQLCGKLLAVTVVLVVVVGAFVLVGGTAWAKQPPPQAQRQQHAPERGVAGAAKSAGEGPREGGHGVASTPPAPQPQSDPGSRPGPAGRSDPDSRADQASPDYQQDADRQPAEEAPVAPRPAAPTGDAGPGATKPAPDPAFKPGAAAAPVDAAPAPEPVAPEGYERAGLPPSAASGSEPAASEAVPTGQPSPAANNGEVPAPVPGSAAPTKAPAPAPSVSYSSGEGASQPPVGSADTTSGATLGGTPNAPPTFQNAVVASVVGAVAEEVTRFFSWTWGLLESTPRAPPGNSLIGGSSRGSGSSFHGGGISLLGVLASFAILLRRISFSWLPRDLLKPDSAPPLALERPG